jgi:hypothetical protein
MEKTIALIRSQLSALAQEVANLKRSLSDNGLNAIDIPTSVPVYLGFFTKNGGGVWSSFVGKPEFGWTVSDAADPFIIDAHANGTGIYKLVLSYNSDGAGVVEAFQGAFLQVETFSLIEGTSSFTTDFSTGYGELTLPYSYDADPDMIIRTKLIDEYGVSFTVPNDTSFLYQLIRVASTSI